MLQFMAVSSLFVLLGKTCVVRHTSVCLSVGNVHLCCPPAERASVHTEIQLVRSCLWVSECQFWMYRIFFPSCKSTLTSASILIRAHVCVSSCVCSSAGRGSICVGLTRWEPQAAGSPGWSKSCGRPEAWNPSRPGQMSLCSGLGLDSSDPADLSRPSELTQTPKCEADHDQPRLN